MPKDTTKESTDEMLASAASTAVRKSTRTGSVTQTSLTAMWTKKSTTSTFSKKTDVSKVLVVANIEETAPNVAGPSTPGSTLDKTSTNQTKAVTEAILQSLEEDTMGETWKKALEPEFKKPYFLQLKKFLLAETSSNVVYPSNDNIYSWSRLTPLEDVKVVILGQDPYHDAGQAHGLSFSVLPPTKPPGSLKNIYKQLEADFPGFKAPKTGDLTPIAKQGVLWLNTSLTVRAHKAGSHSRKGWETFTTQVIRAVLQRKTNDQPGVVFMAWGLPAQKTFSAIGIDQKKHLLLKSPHPSPLSAHRGFLGNGHFKKANEWLAAKYGKDAEIDWTVMSAK